MADSHLRLVAVTKSFDGQASAVDGISLEIPRASFTTLLGPSGCGKTTLLRMIAGLHDPDAGDIFIDSERINHLPAHRRGIAMVFQDYALFPHMTVAENVGYGLKLARVERQELRDRVAQTLRQLDLTGLEDRYPGQLSGGQQQRVAIARAIIVNPAVLLLDEPLSNLDAKLRVSVREELISLQKQLAITTIYVTHDQNEALAMSDWIAVMQKGRVVQWGTPEDIYYRPATPFVADFIGTVNLLPARCLALGPRSASVQIGSLGVELPVNGVRPKANAELLLSIRPESLKILPPGSPISPGQVVQVGQVIRRTFLGHLTRYTVRVADRDWIVDQPDPGIGGSLEGLVTLVLDPRRLHMILL